MRSLFCIASTRVLTDACAFDPWSDADLARQGMSLVANAGVTWVLPSRYRPHWQYGRIGIEVVLVAHNAHVGIKMDF